jgi:hypothetical protein
MSVQILFFHFSVFGRYIHSLLLLQRLTPDRRLHQFLTKSSGMVSFPPNFFTVRLTALTDLAQALRCGLLFLESRQGSAVRTYCNRCVTTFD